MAINCAKHPFESASDTCQVCSRPFCGDCLVWSLGPKKPPYCIPCALAAAGVRRSKAPR